MMGTIEASWTLYIHLVPLAQIYQAQRTVTTEHSTYSSYLFIKRIQRIGDQANGYSRNSFSRLDQQRVVLMYSVGLCIMRCTMPWMHSSIT